MTIKDSKKTSKNSKTNRDAIFYIIGMAICTLFCMFVTTMEATATSTGSVNSNAIFEMVKEKGSVFMVGEGEMLEDISVSELVQKYRTYSENINESKEVTKVYDINDINNHADQIEMNTIKRDFVEIFSGKYDVTELTFVEEEGFYIRIHMFVEIEGCKREYVFYTYNAKPFNEASEIIAKVSVGNNDYCIYKSDGWFCLDCTKHV